MALSSSNSWKLSLKSATRAANAKEKLKEQFAVISTSLHTNLLVECDRVKEALLSKEHVVSALFEELATSLIGLDQLSLIQKRVYIEGIQHESEQVITDLERILSRYELMRNERVQNVMGEIILSVMDIRHGIPHESEQLLADQVKELNLAIVYNKKLYSDIVGQLRVRIVMWEKHLAQQWERMEQSWRTLNYRNAIDQFKATLGSVSYRNPPQRRTILDSLCREQRTKHAQLLDQLHFVYKLVPPTLNADAVEEWKESLLQVLTQTTSVHSQFVVALRAQEAQLHAECHMLVSKLKEDLQQYHVVDDRDLSSIMSECHDLVEGRGREAWKLLAHIEVVLDVQANAAKKGCTSLYNYLKGVAQLCDGQRTVLANFRERHSSQMQSRKHEFEQRLSQHEDQLVQVISAMQTQPDDDALYGQLQRALELLHTIEQDYRDFCAASVALCVEYPKDVRTLLEKQETDICAHFGLTKEPAVWMAGKRRASEERKGMVTKGGETELQPAKPRALALIMEESNVPAIEPVTPEEDIDAITTTTGVKYYILPQTNLSTDALVVEVRSPVVAPVPSTLEAQLPPIQGHPTRRNPVDGPTRRRVNNAIGSVGDTAQTVMLVEQPPVPSTTTNNAMRVTIAEDKSPTRIRAHSRLAKPSPGSSPAVSPALRPTHTSGALAFLPQVLHSLNDKSNNEIDKIEAEIEGIKVHLAKISADLLQVPLDPDGSPCVEMHIVPEALITYLQHNVRRVVLNYTENQQNLTQVILEESKNKKKTLLANLEEQLRLHRPRAAHIELDIYHQRASELHAHRLRFDRHVQVVSEKFRQECRGVKSAIKEARRTVDNYVKTQVQRVASMNNANNTMTVQILLREARSAHVRVSEWIYHQSDSLRTLVNSISKGVETDDKLYAESLQGSGFGEPEVVHLRAQLAALHTRVQLKCSQLIAHVSTLEQALGLTSVGALTDLEEAHKAHCEDLIFLEALNMKINGVQSKVRAEISKSEGQQASIDKLLAQLVTMLQSTIGDDATMRKGNNDFLFLLDHIRHDVYYRAMYLEVLHSSMTIASVYSVDTGNFIREIIEEESGNGSGNDNSDNENGTAQPKEKERAAKLRARNNKPNNLNSKQAQLPKPPQPGSQSPPKLKKNTSKRSTASLKYTSLLKTTARILNSTIKELLAQGEEYYKSKGDRAITRPNRIPQSYQHLSQLLEESQNQLNSTVIKHREQATQDFRIQVENMCSHFAKVPLVVFNDITDQILARCKSQHEVQQGDFEKKWHARQQDAEKTRSAIKPSIGHPNNQPQLQTLLSVAKQEHTEAISSIVSHCENLKQTQCEYAAHVTLRLTATTTTLLQLFDEVVTPQDLISEVDTKPRVNTPERKAILKQLLRKEATTPQQTPLRATTPLTRARSTRSKLPGSGYTDETQESNPRPFPKKSWPAIVILSPTPQPLTSTSTVALPIISYHTPMHEAVLAARNHVYTQYHKHSSASLVAVDSLKQELLGEEQRDFEHLNDSLNSLLHMH